VGRGRVAPCSSGRRGDGGQLEVTPRQWVWRRREGLAEIAAGVLGTAATWVASTGSGAAGEEARTPRLVGACERQARGFWGARCAAWPARQNQLTPALEPHQGTGYQLARTAPLLSRGRPSVLWGVSWSPLGPPAGGHTEQQLQSRGLPPARCASAGAGCPKMRALFGPKKKIEEWSIHFTIK
jgi:hypothetical protein